MKLPLHTIFAAALASTTMLALPAFAQNNQSGGQSGADITVQQPAPDVTVQQPAPEVTVTQPQPEVTVTQPQPKVTVDQPKPEVTVNQPDPKVTVDQPEPKVTVDQAEPDVSVEKQGQANVDVQQQGQPDVQVQQDSQAQNDPSQQQKPNQDAQQGSQAQNDPSQQPTMNQDQSEPQAVGTTAATGAAMSNDNATASSDSMNDNPLYAMRGNEIVGKDVYGSNGDEIGEVDDVVISRGAGKSPAVIIGVGGFLGIGERDVAIPLDQIRMEQDRLVTDMTREQIGGMEAYDQNNWDSWDADRPINQASGG